MLGSIGQDALTRTLALLVVGLIIYVIPSWVAWYRGHHNLTGIVLLNLLLGWTILGWIGALVWAATSPPPKT